jgi:hypothetical protein
VLDGAPDLHWRTVKDGNDFRVRIFEKKAGRGWHHQSRAPRRRSMGQGG